jgi:membrane-bound metal-dependent hydrolase YbcI (DUF457 family)
VEEEGLKDDTAGSLIRRMAIKAASLGSVAALAALGISGNLAAAGALAGSLMAGAYAAGYIRSHLFRDVSNPRFFDSRIVTHSFLRIVAVALVGWGAYAVSRSALGGYLIAFALGFPVLLMTELPLAARLLKARGLLG